MKSRTKAKPGAKPGHRLGPPTGSFGSFAPEATSGGLSYLEAPPDLSGIGPNVTISFKNLLKKDPTTKAKGLDDLVSYVRAHPYENDGGASDAILDAWVAVYPRVSIDNSRQVRELAHTLQLELLKSARKRMEKRIPKIVGTWLAGSFDRDRVVSRTASEGLTSFLNTEEKQTLFWKKCQAQIMDYATAAYQETPNTLCDPRNTTKDDALAVYHRVVSGSMSLVTRLLDISDAEDLQASLADYLDKSRALGRSLASPDLVVRKAAFRLLKGILESQDGAALLKPHMRHLRQCLITDGLGSGSEQQGSAMEFVELLSSMLERFPELWPTEKSLTDLVPLLEKGSQGNPGFWLALDRLFGSISVHQNTISHLEAMKITRALRIGLSQRYEFRGTPGAIAAWTQYLTIVRRLGTLLKKRDEGAEAGFLLENVTFLWDYYLFPSSEKSDYATGIYVPVLTQSVVMLTNDSMQAALNSEWERLASTLETKISASAPETSKTHEQSQKEIGEAGTRWFTLTTAIQEELVKQTGDTSGFTRPLESLSMDIIQKSFSILERRNYKPYGAALVIKAACTGSRIIENHRELILSKLFPTGQLKIILLSPSAPHLIHCLNAMAMSGHYRHTFEVLMRAALEPHESESQPLVDRAIGGMLATSAAGPIAHSMPDLQEYLTTRCRNIGVHGAVDPLELVSTAITHDSMTAPALHGAISGLVQHLGNADIDQVSLLAALEIIAEKKPMALREVTLQLDLITKLLGMVELNDSDISVKAAALQSRLSTSSTESNVAGSIAKIIQQNIEKVGPDSLSVDTLVAQAVAAWKAGSAQPEDLFPSTTVWMDESVVFLQGGMDPSLSLTSNMRGAYLLVQGEKARRPRVNRDRKGLSIPARMALYTTNLLSSGVSISPLPRSFQAEILFLLYLAVGIGSDQIASKDDSQLWGPISHPENMVLADEAISSIKESVNSILLDPASDSGDGEGSLLDVLIDITMKQTQELCPMGVYAAKAASEILQTLVESRGLTSADRSIVAKVEACKGTPSDVLGAIGILTGYGEVLASDKGVSNLCNRLVSDVAGAKADGPATLIKLVLLGVCMSIYDNGELPVANNRLVFAVRQITEWFENTPVLNHRIASESMRVLQFLLPCVKDIYGPYWQRTVDYSLRLWRGAAKDDTSSRLPYLHASLKLLYSLEKIVDPNDDLADALRASIQDRSQAMLDLLELLDTGYSLAGYLVIEFLCRMVAKMPTEHIRNTECLYGLVASDIKDIQNTAFGLLHKALPAAQESLSVDVLLENRSARLPNELLSLLLEAPTLEKYPDEVLSRFPSAIRSYLLAWLLIFDCYSTASAKVRDDYTEHLKNQGLTRPLMTFTFDALGHTAARPISLDKEGFTEDHITSYDVALGDIEFEERELDWVLIHLFYLTLKYTPGLFRSWYLSEGVKKGTKMHIKAWMTQSFSPLIIDGLLTDVANWAATQEKPEDDEKELVVKISRLGREVTASYEVDEENAVIAIKIPPAYPIDGVVVNGVSRVVVPEKKWQSWLMITQGVISFSNGSIIDGLTTFRRNIVGALKNHTECAICYSIISSDKRTPDKPCRTCRNMFHRTCLYKWFQTSGQNYCPLCRNPIDYLGASGR